VIIGIDLTLYEIVSISPDNNVTLGWQPGSFVKGIAWNGALTTNTFSFAIRGILLQAALTTAFGSVPYQLGGLVAAQDSMPTSCSAVGTVLGPSVSLATSVTYQSSSPLSGLVVISGARFGIDRTASIPVQDVPIALFSSSGSLLGLTFSNAQGIYTFHDVSSSANVTLQPLQDGILRPALRSSGDWLRATEYDVLGINSITGPPHSLSNTTFKLLIDETELPVYSIPVQSTQFFGNAKSLAYWQYELEGYGELAGDLSASQINTWRSQATTYLLSLSNCPVNLYSTDPLEANLFAAALNQVSGRGFFSPYRTLQKWMIAYSQHVFCAGIQDNTDRSIALQFVLDINSATDANT